MHSTLKPAINELSSFNIFQGVEPALIEQLCEGGRVQVHKHKTEVFCFGESANYFAIVLSGAYKLSRLSPNGEESVIHFSAPGDVIAALIMSQANSVYPVSVKAMGPSRLLLLHRDIYMKYWLKNPELIIKVQQLLSNRMSRLQNQKVMQRTPMQAKIAALMLQLAAKDLDDSKELDLLLPLTRKEIADTLGVAVESVIRVMSEWVKKGYISTIDQNIKILRPDILINQIESPD